MGNPMSTPTHEQKLSAPDHVTWEYVSLLAAAQQMAEDHRPPINHLVQEAYLVHLRNLAEFFDKGVTAFKENQGVPPARDRDNIYAVDLCRSVKWDAKPFSPKTRLRRAIDKTLSHMTYSRDLSSGFSEIGVAFHGPSHVHGTLMLVRRAWEKFLDSLDPQYTESVAQWLDTHAEHMGVSLGSFYTQFDQKAKHWQHCADWHLNETPDGPI